ncbi:hypothetical protein SBOR_0384 [Sclerotinia borealis F-4128]|uniref:Uncharacterized protein n=1 Tax=Sclerotinia borealis (strain F-4128) TaxID=1432307 RepID=W9CTM5_SCLBF|nr:hypothetical protein SBOR_0384 [Sclerotinia borealis F-4128]
MPEAEQTNNGDYEYIEEHTWGIVDYDRYMSWKAGDGKIIFNWLNILNARTTERKVFLRAGREVTVKRTVFKLVKAVIVKLEDVEVKVEDVVVKSEDVKVKLEAEEILFDKGPIPS